MEMGRKRPIICISGYMTTYVYQIRGALENFNKRINGFQVFVGIEDTIHILAVPIEIFSSETKNFVEFRLKLTERFSMQKLPPTVEMDIRVPIEHWLDEWVNCNYYGDFSK